MFTILNEAKALIIDLESIEDCYDEEWDKLPQSVRVLFCCTDDERLKHIQMQLQGAYFHHGTPFGNVAFRPQEYKQILDALEVESFNSIVVVGSFKAVRQAINFNLASIMLRTNRGTAYEYAGRLPDIQVSKMERLISILKKENVGYWAEFCAERYEGKESRCLNASQISTSLQVKPGLTCKIVAGGRYYSQSDSRSFAHQLSRRIILHKNKKTSQAGLFASVYQAMLYHLLKEKEIHGITRVPPKQRDQFDRFKEIVKALAKQHEMQDMSEQLICLRDYGEQKTLGSVERAANIKGSFSIEADVKGKRIVVLDDVVTTGATVKEIAGHLYNRGAGEVIFIVLAINQFCKGGTELKPVKCKLCDGSLRLRINNETQEAFFGCENFKDSAGCKYTESYLSVLNIRNEEAKFVYEPDDNIDNIEF